MGVMWRRVTEAFYKWLKKLNCLLPAGDSSIPPISNPLCWIVFLSQSA